MNIAEDIYKINRKYIMTSINRSVYPEIKNIFINLDLEFGEDWQILLTKQDVQKWFLSITQMSYIQIDKNTEEIIIHDNNTLQEFKNNKKQTTSTNLSTEDLSLSLKLLCLEYKIDWNVSKPFVSFRAIIQGNRVRVTLTHSSLSEEHSHKCSIRILGTQVYPLESYFNNHAEKEVIKKHFSNKKNIIVCGSTGSGKTSFLTSLLKTSEDDQHVLIIEDTLEIKSPNDTTTRFVANDKPNHSLSDYCSYALRMRPERIVLGEIRSHEVVPLILNTNTGHKGILTTIHANSALDCPSRISTLLCLYSGISGMNNETALDLITAGIDTIIFLENKKVKNAISIIGHERGKVNYEEILKPMHEEPLQHFQYLR
ncbi:ATPase, T2SS/T4P/T4SS family [Halobacteriovorax sp.]|uniref:ATPase, T2SS/T4P/T4SS family n=1 Tax=Halobacteriovorax sp. TaxID=2020862 RepID=UPI003563F7B3